MPPNQEYQAYHFEGLVPAAGATQHHGVWTPPDTLPFLAGHFPGLPMVPAAVILEVSLEFLRQACANPRLKLVRVRHGKFKAPVTPEMALRITATSPAAGSWQLVWTPVSAAAQASDLVAQMELQTA